MDPVKGIWTGSDLTNIQKLCINSFLENGHPFQLYVYEDIKGIPEGTTILDANTVIPYKEKSRFKSENHFSDYFRSNVTYYEGGWYVDMDIVCLKPFDFPQPYVFVSEYQYSSSKSCCPTAVNCCIIKTPQFNPMTFEIIKRIDNMDLQNAGWIDVGPAQYRKAVPEFGLERYIQRPEIFDGLWPSELKKFISFNSVSDWYPPEVGVAIHLRTSYWKPEAGLDPNGKYPENSQFEKLKRRYHVE